MKSPNNPIKKFIMKNDDLCCFEKWYQSQCNNVWERKYGIKIDTIDNPGWMVIIDLFHTNLYQKLFNEIDLTKSVNNWIQCNIKNNQFQGFGGPLNLGDLIQVFNLWSGMPKINKKNENLIWLQKWYYSECNGDWEHVYGITIETVDSPGWYATIDLKDTYLENAIFEKIKEDKNDLDWFFCLKKGNKFEASCGPRNLNKALHIFRQWSESCADKKWDN